MRRSNRKRRLSLYHMAGDRCGRGTVVRTGILDWRLVAVRVEASPKLSGNFHAQSADGLTSIGRRRRSVRVAAMLSMSPESGIKSHQNQCPRSSGMSVNIGMGYAPAAWARAASVRAPARWVGSRLPLCHRRRAVEGRRPTGRRWWARQTSFDLTSDAQRPDASCVLLRPKRRAPEGPAPKLSRFFRQTISLPV